MTAFNTLNIRFYLVMVFFILVCCVNTPIKCSHITIDKAQETHVTSINIYKTLIKKKKKLMWVAVASAIVYKAQQLIIIVALQNT